MDAINFNEKLSQDNPFSLSLSLSFANTWTELLEIQNAIQDKDVKLLLERSISTLSSTSGEKS